MAIERAYFQAVHKPWGSTDLRPWGEHLRAGDPVGELWCQRAGVNTPEALRLKLLFTKERLSVQVHPDDTYARSVGLTNGKTEAWYILAAAPGAQIALGLQREVTASELGEAIDDGSIAELVQWRDVREGEVIVVPAGTIHAIGAGIVAFEIQQKSDATFRLFDYGRNRELHRDHALAVAVRGPAVDGPVACRISGQRTCLAVDDHFVIERLDLSPESSWSLDAPAETWLFALRGSARIGSFDVSQAGIVFAEGEPVKIESDESGLSILVAYPGPAVRPGLLCRLEWFTGLPATGPADLRMIAPSALADIRRRRLETLQ